MLSNAIEANRTTRAHILGEQHSTPAHSAAGLDSLNDKLHDDISRIQGILSGASSEAVPSQEVHLVEGRVGNLLEILRQLQQKVNTVQTDNTTLSMLVSSNGDMVKLKQELQSESGALQQQIKQLQQKMKHQRQVQGDKERRSQVQLDHAKEATALPAQERELVSPTWRISVLRGEKQRLQSEKMRLEAMFEVDGSTRKESESLCQKLELETTERDIEVIKSKAVSTERFKLRPLMRELTMLKQQHQDLAWSLHDKQLISDKNDNYLEQLTEIETQKLKNVAKLRRCFADKMAVTERRAQQAKNTAEAVNIGNHQLRQSTQLMMQQQAISVNAVRVRHEREAKVAQLKSKNLAAQYEELQEEDKHWKRVVAENVEYIDKKLNDPTQAALDQHTLGSLQQIDFDLRSMGHYAVGANNIIYCVQDSKLHPASRDSTDTEEVVNMLDDCTPPKPRGRRPPPPPLHVRDDASSVSSTARRSRGVHKKRRKGGGRKDKHKNIGSTIKQKIRNFDHIRMI